jgi:hypothetical protein
LPLAALARNAEVANASLPRQKPLNLRLYLPRSPDRRGRAGVPAALTFRPVRSTYAPPAAGPLNADIRRGFEIPEQSSPLAGSTFKRGLGESGLFGFPKQQAYNKL